MGGRTYSFKDELTGDIIDNGQHILMGCYKDTLELADIIRAKENFIIEHSISINFVHKDFGIKQFRSISRIYPFNLAAGLLSYTLLSFKRKNKNNNPFYQDISRDNK